MTRVTTNINAKNYVDIWSTFSNGSVIAFLNTDSKACFKRASIRIRIIFSTLFKNITINNFGKNWKQFQVFPNKLKKRERES